MWRGAAERELPVELRALPTPEFAAEADIWPPGLDRREFLRLMGASLALGGVAGCTRPASLIVPYVVPPDDTRAGGARFYATAVPVEGFGRGILVESHLGRPTKIEGNPDHPESLGATDAVTQAAILALYDPDRSRVPLRQGAPSSWAAFEADWAARREGLVATRGRGLALLTEPTTSPSLRREIGAFLAAFPEARWYQHTPLPAYSAGGFQADYDFGAARTVLLIGSDCLFRHPACVRYSRALVSLRRPDAAGALGSRLYAVEATPTLSGALADQRLAASPERTRLVLDAIAAAVEGGSPPSSLHPEEQSFVAAVAADLRRHAPAVACVAGPEQDAAVQAWALALNGRLGSLGRAARLRPAVRSDADPRSAGSLGDLAAALRANDLQALVILGSNPAYTSREFRGLGAELGRVAFTAHLGSHADETAALCGWHLPEAHFLETWGDLRGYDGTATLLQPLIEPLFGGRSALEVLHALHDPAPTAARDLVRATWSGPGGVAFEVQWARWLARGVVDEAAAEEAAPPAPAVPALARGGGMTGRWLIIVPDASVLDGRWSNNAWLQELPRPLTQLVWDNAALVSPALAAELGIENGDMLRLEHGTAAAEAAAWVMPGQAPDCVTLSLGYGRTRAGSVGNGHGFDAYPLRSPDEPWLLPNLRVTRTGARYPLVTTQHHFTMEGRDPVRVVVAGQGGSAAPDPGTTLYPAEWPEGRYAWGMSIDLGACTGCNACVVACQAENNTPVVGKDQVARGREMHWIRIDRYFDGPLEAPRILNQPVTCMQCENAPCEVVCPVGATVHSSEGLNQMVYNRCVGTRYCSNNCPYKVRRFNFLDYRDPPDSPVNLQKNPDVTVRERGVMEKCTYCVQRINAARIAAAKANRPIRDGEIRTACQQACPVEAIVFGNIADPGSRVSAARRRPTNYSLLGELNTRPRTTYLARVVAAGEGGTA